jgi:hypothetical protein
MYDPESVHNCGFMCEKDQSIYPNTFKDLFSSFKNRLKLFSLINKDRTSPDLCSLYDYILKPSKKVRRFDCALFLNVKQKKSQW